MAPFLLALLIDSSRLGGTGTIMHKGADFTGMAIAHLIAATGFAMRTPGCQNADLSHNLCITIRHCLQELDKLWVHGYMQRRTMELRGD